MLKSHSYQLLSSFTPHKFYWMFLTSQYFWKSRHLFYKGNAKENAMNKQLPSCSRNNITTIKSILANARLILRVFGSLLVCEKVRGTRAVLIWGSAETTWLQPYTIQLKELFRSSHLVSERQRWGWRGKGRWEIETETEDVITNQRHYYKKLAWNVLN